MTGKQIESPGNDSRGSQSHYKFGQWFYLTSRVIGTIFAEIIRKFRRSADKPHQTPYFCGYPTLRLSRLYQCPLFVEYEAVLLRLENLQDREVSAVELFLDFLLSVTHLQEVFFAWRPALRDPDDDFILELAVAAGCRYIVPHNVRDFSGSEKWGITAITPSNFLKLIGRQT